MKFIDRLTRFMYGRYGNDNLNQFIVIIAFLIVVANIFIGSIVIYFVSLALFILSFLRILSKNRYARSKENKAYLRITRRFTGIFKLIKNKWRDRKTHVYKKCPECKSILRLPKKKGKHTVNCPRCHNRFEINI